MTMYKNRKKYTKVEMTTDEAQQLYEKFLQGLDKIHILETEKWSDCTTYDCMYRGVKFMIYDYKDGNMEIGYNDLSEETEKVIDSLDFILYHKDLKRG